MSEQPPASSRAGEPSSQYVVVARRYRPQTFDELIGQQHVARALSSAIEADRVGHAYLFTGARGVGKTSAARILAKALNCESGPTATPCQHCDVCESVSAGEDVDVLEIDGASNRGIDEIRQLRQNVGVRPSRARFKIYIIDEVHMLTKEAFNALLKTLEEPPEHVKFIFATTDPNKIPITVLSRCQRFDFAGIEAVAIQERLAQIAETEGVEVEPEALALLARRANGSMRDSQSLLEQLLSAGSDSITTADVNALLGTAPAERLGSLATHLIERDAAAALSDLDQALSEGTEVGQLAEQLLGYFRDVMALSVGCRPEQMLHCTPGQADEVSAAAERLGVETILAIVQILEQTVARMRMSVHTRTLTEMALVRICSLEDLDTLAHVVASLRAGEIPSGASGAPTRKDTAGRGGAASAGAAPGRAVAPKKNGLTGPSSPASASTAYSEGPAGSAAVATISAAGGTCVSQTDSGSLGTASLSAESVDSVWQQVLSQLDGLVSEHAAFAESITVSGPNHLVAGFKTPYNFHKAQCERPEQKSQIEHALAEVVGRPTRVEFATLRVDPEQTATPPPARKPSRRQLQAEIGQRPFVRRALELFDAAEYRVGFPDNP